MNVKIIGHMARVVGMELEMDVRLIHQKWKLRGTRSKRPCLRLQVVAANNLTSSR